AAVPIERERVAGLELLEIPVVTRERERLRVQLQAQGRRKRGVRAQRHVELMLEQLGEDVPRAERRGGRVVSLLRDDLRHRAARGVSAGDLEREGGARAERQLRDGIQVPATRRVVLERRERVR